MANGHGRYFLGITITFVINPMGFQNPEAHRARHWQLCLALEGDTNWHQDAPAGHAQEKLLGGFLGSQGFPGLSKALYRCFSSTWSQRNMGQTPSKS